MTNIDKLKAAAAKAVDNFDPNMFVETRDVLALLDELEAKDRKILKLEKLAEAESVGADKAAASGVEWMKRCLAAEKRIAEQNKTLMASRSYVKSHAAGDGHAFGVLQAIDRAAGIGVKGE
ncbi:TPA: hypothetical protein ACM36I_000375 [Escherichia coli]|uniref:hypothetical protein n=1 Tax=Escherichia coli TaxID=562 RepID=UPI0004D5928E|nr:hypothetical protein [Escherichia coli]KDW24532.1 hypothetical protein AC68_1283 [Escherichia coli 2-156-04_S4_C1]HEI3387777.1 hypothetical protein [Escherichia coli]